MSLGGIGIPVSSVKSSAAFATSVFGTWQLQMQMGINQPRLGALESYATFPNFNLDDNNNYNNLQLSQHEFSLAQDLIAYGTLLENSHDREKALIQSKTLKYASAWLTASPSTHNAQNIRSAEFKAALKFHTGQPFTHASRECPECNKASDKLGDHAITCRNTGQRINKHNSLRNFILEKAKLAQIDCQQEQEVTTIVNGTEVVNKLGDIVLSEFIQGRDLWLDVGIISPLCTAYVQKAVSTTGGAIAVRVGEKMKKYATAVSEHNLKFQPLIVENLGGWGKDSIMLFRTITKKLAEVLFTDGKKEMKNLMTGLSCRLQKSIGRMLVSLGFRVRVT